MEINDKGFSDKALEDFELIDKAVIENDQQAYANLMKRY
ncbi:MAG: RNA polymerase subunit sigma-24, partial [Cyclobacteriaceae bacterium]